MATNTLSNLPRFSIRAHARPHHQVRQRTIRNQCSASTPAFLEDVQILTVNDQKYVPLEEVEKQLNPLIMDAEGAKAKLQDEATEARALAEKLKKDADELQQQLQKKQTELSAVEVEVEEARDEARRAVLVAAEQLEERFQSAYRLAHQQETASLQEQLADAVKVATAAEEKAVEATRQAGEQLMQRTQEAAQQVETSTFTYITLAKGASSAAQLAAEEAGASVKVSLEQQKEALALIKSVEETASAAEARAAASYQQAQALVGEVGALRTALTTSQKEAAEASKRATQAEAEAAARIAKADTEVAARLKSLEEAYEQLRKAERERVQRALEENQALTRQNQALVEEGEKLRADFAAAEQAVAQAKGQAVAAELAVKVKGEEVEKEFQRKLAAQEQELRAQALVEVQNAQDERWLAASETVQGVRGQLEAQTNEMTGQVAALQRVVDAQSQERAYWRNRCLKAEGESRMLSLQLKKALDTVASLKHTPDKSEGGTNFAVGVPRRLSTLLNKEKLWQFMSSGPRGQSPIGSGFVLGTATLENGTGKEEGEEKKVKGPEGEKDEKTPK